MRVLVYTLCAVIVLTVVAFGQVNIEASRLPQNSEDGIYITSELGYEVKRGNTYVTEIKSKLRTDYIKGKHHTFLSARYEYGASADQAFKDAKYAHLRHTYMVWKHIGVEEFVQTQSREFNDLKLRQLFGVGSRFEMKSDMLVFALGTGAMLEYEDLAHSSSTEWVIRSTNYVSARHKLGEKDSPLQAYAIVYVQPLISRMEDFRVLADIGLEYRVFDILSIVNSFNALYDTQPPIGVGRFDLSNGLKLRIAW